MSQEGAHGVLPLPTWDDPEEELDYNDDFTSDPVQNEDRVEEPCSSQNVASPSLPRMEELEPQSSRNIGPSLPPGFALDNRMHPDDPEDPNSQSRRLPGSDNDSLPSLPVIGPELPTSSRQIGPALPPHLVSRDDAPSLPDAELRARSSEDFVSNHVPPPEPTARQIGPALPTDFRNNTSNSTDGEAADVPRLNNEPALVGPSLPRGLALPSSDDDYEETENYLELPSEDEEVVGPSLPSSSNGNEELQYYERLAKLEQEKEKEKNKSKREEWMLALPNKNYDPKVFNPGVFSKRGVAQPSAEWTETPAQKKKRLENGDGPGPSTSSNIPAVKIAAKTRDAEQAAIAARLNENRGTSMLEETRRQTVQPNGEDEAGRRAFDRERDMQVRGLQNLSTEEIKARCGELNSRFGHGGDQKFL